MLLSKRLFLTVLTESVLAASVAGAQPATAVVRQTLANGMKVVVVRNPLAPVVTTEINYLVGSDETPAAFPGTAHAVEHMMFRGSPGLSAAQLSTIAAAMGGDFDADTQQTVTQYFFTVPADQLEIALRIEAIRMRGILATPPLWAQERGAIDQEVAQDLSDPEYVLSTKVLAHMFAGTPYARDALGTRSSFQATTAATLQAFHNTWYAPNNAILVVAGDVDPAATLGRIRELFDGIAARPLPSRPPVRLQPPQPAHLRLDTDSPYGLALVAYRLPGYASPDYAAGEILADVLDSQRADLYGLVPAGKALAADFETSMLPDAGVGYAVAQFPRGGDGDTLVAAMKRIIAGYVAHGVPGDLVEAAKRHEETDAEFAMNSVAGLAASWSQALAVEGRRSPADDIEAVKRVTPDDVNRVARAYLLNDTALTGVLIPTSSGKPIAPRSRGGRESFAPKRATAVEVPAWAKSAVAMPAAPASLLHPTVMTLPNGLRLIVQPETISQTITLTGRVKSNPDLQVPPGEEGVAGLLDSLFSYGTVTRDRLAFQKALDDIGAVESAGTSFSLRVLAGQFDKGLGLLAENLLQPALPAPALEILRQEALEALPGERQSPGYLAGRTLLAALYPKHDPTLRQATQASLSSIDLARVKAYYESVFRPDMTTIVIAGATTPEEARAAVEKWFGAWTARGPRPETTLPPVPANAPASSVVPDRSRVQDAVTLAETVEVTRKDPDYYPLQVGNHVLSGGFYATRLYRDLRERAGLVYSVDAALEAGKTRSLYTVSYACDPPNVAKARAMIARDLATMQAAPVGDVELRQAKTLLVRQIPLSESSVDAIAGQMLALSLEDLPLDEPVREARRYLESTAAQVRDAFAKWIRPAGFVQVTVGPAPR
jgi:zinc protease